MRYEKVESDLKQIDDIKINLWVSPAKQEAALSNVSRAAVEKAEYERLLKIASNNLDLAIFLARLEGCSLREIEKYAKVSNVSVLNAERRVKEVLREKK